MRISTFMCFFIFLQFYLIFILGAGNSVKNANNSTTAAPEIENTHRGDVNNNSGPESSLVCTHVLCGHNSPVTAISYATDLDIVLSGSQYMCD